MSLKCPYCDGIRCKWLPEDACYYCPDCEQELSPDQFTDVEAYSERQAKELCENFLYWLAQHWQNPVSPDHDI